VLTVRLSLTVPKHPPQRHSPQASPRTQIVGRLSRHGKSMKTNNKIIVILIAISIFLSGCSPAITKETAEKELVSFMLDFIVQQEIGGTANYIQTSGQPWVDAPPNANIIVWYPPAENFPGDTIRYLQIDEPIKVWLYADNKLVEATDKKETIQKYDETQMLNPESDIWAWGSYGFGILSISESNNEAKVFFGVSCGPLCGHSVIYTVKRNTSGKWEIKDEQILEVS
jgi:hypothetical protein